MNGPQHPPFVLSIDVGAGAGAGPVVSAPTEGTEDLARGIRELVNLTRELLNVSREQLELVRRAEDRFQKQQDAQREEFARWLAEHPEVEGRCEDVHEQLRRLFGRSLAELIRFVDENEDGLIESDFVRSEMVDRFGALLNHVSAMYGIVKRLAAAEQAGDSASS